MGQEPARESCSRHRCPFLRRPGRRAGQDLGVGHDAPPRGPQPLLSVLGAAQHGGGHLGILAEVLHAGRRDHGYLASREELTPLAHDPKALVPLAMATAATVAVPRSWSWFTSGSVSNYALTGEGWHQLLEFDPSLRYDRKGSGPGPTKARRSRRTGTELEVGPPS